MRGRQFLNGVLWYVAGAATLLTFVLLFSGGGGLLGIVDAQDAIVLILGALVVGIGALTIQHLEYSRPTPANRGEGARPQPKISSVSFEIFSWGSLAFIIGAAVACAVTPSDEVVDAVDPPRGTFDDLVIDGDRDGIAVAFDHDHANTKIANERACGWCHHLNNPGEESTSCSECHQSMAEKTDIFDHDDHADHLGGNRGCETCHSDPNMERSRETMSPSCDDCHGPGKNLDLNIDIFHNRMIAEATFIKTEEWIATSYRDAMHKLCIECHRAQGVRNDEGEIKGTRCPDCHPSGGVRESDLDG